MSRSRQDLRWQPLRTAPLMNGILGIIRPGGGFGLAAAASSAASSAASVVSAWFGWVGLMPAPRAACISWVLSLHGGTLITLLVGPVPVPWDLTHGCFTCMVGPSSWVLSLHSSDLTSWVLSLCRGDPACACCPCTVVLPRDPCVVRPSSWVLSLHPADHGCCLCMVGTLLVGAVSVLWGPSWALSLHISDLACWVPGGSSAGLV